LKSKKLTLKIFSEDKIISEFLKSLEPWRESIVIGGGFALFIYKLYLADPMLENLPVGTRDIDSLIPRKVPEISKKNIAKYLNEAGSLLRSEVGLKFIEAVAFSSWNLFIKEKASYIYEKPHGNHVTTFLTGIPAALSVIALNQGLNLGSFGFELFAEIGDSAPWGLALSYDGEFGSAYLSNEVALTLSKSF